MVKMKRLLNQPEAYVTEMLEGIYAAHPDQVACVGDDVKCLATTHKKPGKVAICTGGGSGHLPLFLGYVGDGLLDGCCVGEVFQSPRSMQILETTKHIDNGAGVLYIYGNYSGDILNFDMAKDMAEMEDIEIRQVVAGDDVASAPKEKAQIRRGVAGIYYVYKCAGAAADEMMSLDEVTRVAEKVCANVRTMGMALSPCIIPEVGKPSFEITEGEMEIGMGIHGEPGIQVEPLKSADEIVDIMLPKILEDLPYENGDEVAVLVNGLGATPKEDLYVIFRRISQVLKEKGISVFHVDVGEYATAMEMAGMSISLLKLDDELKRLVARPCHTPFFTQVQL